MTQLTVNSNYDVIKIIRADVGGLGVLSVYQQSGRALVEQRSSDFVTVTKNSHYVTRTGKCSLILTDTSSANIVYPSDQLTLVVSDNPTPTAMFNLPVKVTSVTKKNTTLTVCS